MNKTKTKLTIDIINSIMMIMCAFCILCSSLSYELKTSNILYDTAIVMIFPIIISFFKYLKNSVPLMILYVACFLSGMLFVIFNGYEVIQIVLYCLVIILFFSINLASMRNESEAITPSCSAIFVIIVGYISANIAHNDSICKMIACFLLVAIMLYIISIYISNIFTFFEGNILSGVMNYKYAIRMSSKYIITFLLITAAIMSITIIFSPGEFFIFLKNNIGSFLKWLAGLFHQKKVAQYVTLPPESTPAPTKIKVTDAPTPVPTVTPDYGFLDKYTLIPALIGGVLLIALVLFCIFYGLRHTRKKAVETKTFVSPFEKNEVAENPEEKKPGLFSRIFGRSPQKRIRRAFKNTIDVNTRIGAKIINSHTPTQLCDSTDKSLNQEDLSTLKNLYEKARYSNETITKQDADNASTISKKLRS